MKTIKELEAEKIIANSINNKFAELNLKLVSAQLSYSKDVLGLIDEIKEKSLELSKLNLCGYSQDDVWERAIQYAKEELKKRITG